MQHSRNQFIYLQERGSGGVMAQAASMLASPSIATKKTFYKPELDALRFLAFMMVFLGHTPSIQGIPGAWIAQRAGGYGVCIFFILSAYLIAELLIRESENTGTVHIRAFFVRRVLRIWPLYFLVLFLGFTLGEVVKSEHIPIAALPYMLLLAGNFWVAKAGWQLGMLVPMWSLSVEEQFYLVVPTLIRIGGRRALLVMSLISIVSAYGALVCFGLHGTDANTKVWASSLVQFQFFGAGTLLALSLHGRVWTAGWSTRCALLLVGLIGLCVAEGGLKLRIVGTLSVGHLTVGYATVLLSCLAIFFSILNLPVKLPDPLVYLGRISFGLYVYHIFLLKVVFKGGVSAKLSTFAMGHIIFMSVLCLLGTIAIAALSFRCFEKPILRYKERFAYVRSGASSKAMDGNATFPMQGS
jgi:peptidoglycan/LPS O-acetylase OafA/YrhL